MKSKKFGLSQCVLTAGLAISALSASVHGVIINVPAQFTTIQGAIDAAVDGDEIVVAPGNYPDRLNFAGTGNFTAKSIIVRSSGGAAVTFIDRTGIPAVNATAITIANNTVTVLPVNATFDGFTIRNATRTNATASRGAAIITGGNSGQIFIRNCVFEGCSATTAGGAISFTGGSATIENCTFRFNRATPTGNGGAIVVRGTFATTDYTGLSIIGCTFEDNYADGFGGAINIEDIQQPTIRGCTFISNQCFDETLATPVTTGSGGAINISLNGGATIEGNTFFANASPRAGGGAIHLHWDAAAGTPIASARIRGNKFIANTSDTNSAAIFVGRPTVNGTASSPVEISNNLIIGNVAGGRVGGVNGNFSAIAVVGPATASEVIIANNTIAGNRGLTTAGAPSGTTVGSVNGVIVKVNNNIIRGNVTDANGALVVVGGVGMTATYNNLENLATTQGGIWVTSAGNIDALSVFTDVDGADNTLYTLDDDFSLAANSPDIDAGSNADVPAGLLVDLGGAARFQDDPGVADTGAGTAPIVDIGAYERAGAPVCNADYNQDGGADNADIVDLANDIAGGTQSYPPNSPDFNNDGSADNADIVDLANVVAGGNCP